MIFDCALAAVVLAFGFLGASSGGMVQIASLLGYAAGWLGARPLAELLTPAVVAQLHYSAGLTRAVLSLVLFSVLAAIASKIAREVYIRMFDGPDGETIDKKFGFVMGSIKGALITYLIAAAYVTFKGDVSAPGMFGEAEQGSRAQVLIAEYNVFAYDNIAALAPLRKMLAVRRNGGEMTPNALAELLKDPEFRSALSSANAAASPQSDDMNQLLNDPQVQKMMSDPRLKKLLKEAAPVSATH